MRNVLETSLFYKDEEERQSVGIAEDRLIPLTKKGWQQARKTGKALRKKFGVFDHVFSSDYKRAVETLEGIKKVYGPAELGAMKIEEDPLVRERDLGYCLNMIEVEILEIFPWFLKYWGYASPLDRVPIGGESIRGMAEGRLNLFLKNLENLVGDSENKKILIVSHGRAILGMRYLLENWNYDKVNFEIKNHNPPNASVTIYVTDCWGKPILKSANKTYY